MYRGVILARPSDECICDGGNDDLQSFAGRHLFVYRTDAFLRDESKLL